MSDDQPAPRTRIGFPLIVNRRWPSGVSSEPYSWMPKRVSARSEVAPPASTPIARV